MAVPDFQSFFLSLLDIAVAGKEHSMKEAREIIAKRMNIADADLREMLPRSYCLGKELFCSSAVLNGDKRLAGDSLGNASKTSTSETCP